MADTEMGANRETYKLAEEIRDMLAKHAAKMKSEEEANCALRIASALWVKSAAVEAAG